MKVEKQVFVKELSREIRQQERSIDRLEAQANAVKRRLNLQYPLEIVEELKRRFSEIEEHLRDAEAIADWNEFMETLNKEKQDLYEAILSSQERILSSTHDAAGTYANQDYQVH